MKTARNIALILGATIAVGFVLYVWTLGWQYTLLTICVSLSFWYVFWVFTVAIPIFVTGIVWIIQSTNRS